MSGKSEVRTCVRCGTPVNIIGQCPACLAKDDPEERFLYRLGERVFLTARDAGGACGEVIGQEHGELPPAIGGGMEERVNVRLDDGTETGMIPIVLVKLLKDQRPVVEQTHDPAQGLPRDPVAEANIEHLDGWSREMSKSVDDGKDDCLPQAGRRHPGHCPAPERPESERGVASQAGGFDEERARPYLEPVAKEPATLNATATDLEDLAGWMKHGTLGSIKMRELRQRIIAAAIKVKGCSEAWRREKRPIPRKAPLPGTGSWVMKNLAADVGSIMTSVDNYLEAKTNRTMKVEILDRMKNLAEQIREKQEVWVETEREVVKLHQELERVRFELTETASEKADRVINRLAVAMGLSAHVFLAPKDRQPEHKLLFFGPSVADDRMTKEMKRTGTLPENQMDDRINQLMREGWRVVYRHYDPSFHVQQWRVILEKP